MALTTEQKSVYLIIINATMILRSIGKTFRGNKKKLKNFKITVFAMVEKLLGFMESNELTNEHIINAIGELKNRYNISFGQAQKAINVLLKYHYYLYKKNINENIKSILHCPLDSVILDKLGLTKSLTRINKENYLNIQKKISEITPSKIDFDKEWDLLHLKDEGIL